MGSTAEEIVVMAGAEALPFDATFVDLDGDPIDVSSQGVTMKIEEPDGTVVEYSGEDLDITQAAAGVVTFAPSFASEGKYRLEGWLRSGDVVLPSYTRIVRAKRSITTP